MPPKLQVKIFFLEFSNDPHFSKKKTKKKDKHIYLCVSTHSKRKIERKDIRVIQIRRDEVKLSLFADDMILYVDNPKDATRKLLGLINEFGKIA